MIFGKKPNSQPPVQTEAGTADRQNIENTRMLAILVREYLKEKKAKRRWGMLIKLLLIGCIAMITLTYYQFQTDEMVFGEHTALVELNGIISASDVSADQINQSLAEAFESEFSVGVILSINSPGGSPVQAAQINEEITRLKTRYPDKPFYVSVTDICVSGGYYVAVSADEIFAHPSSIVGSIGVLMDGFGFVDTMKQLGIERRLITAGQNKGLLDPFSPIDPSHQQHVQSVLDDVHQQFINAVKVGRGERLKNDADIFSGLFWSGKKARELGLIDQFGSVQQIARDIIGAETVVSYTPERSLLYLLTKEVGGSAANIFLRQAMNMR